jgi:hypothetical protein
MATFDEIRQEELAHLRKLPDLQKELDRFYAGPAGQAHEHDAKAMAAAYKRKREWDAELQVIRQRAAKAADDEYPHPERS